MANCEMLKALIEERGMKRRFLARQIGVSDAKMHKLLNGGAWKLSDVIAVSEVLNLTKKQRDEIFFD